MTECACQKPNMQTAVALGYFDGVHLGHRAVISCAVAQAGTTLVPAAFTFSTGGGSPEKKRGAAALSSAEEKLELLKKVGIQRVENPDFTEFQGMTPEEFVKDFLQKRMNAKVLCCGSDFRFGKGAAAGVEELKQIAQPLGMQICVVPAVELDGAPVSSSRIREAVRLGRLEEAARLLGRPYSFASAVVQGKHLGRKLGFPTANQPLPRGRCMPPAAVYAAWIQTPDGLWRMGVCNIGDQPTVEGNTPLAETYILDYSGDLYGQVLRLAPWHKLRDIEKFDSVEELRRAVLCNADQARTVLSSQKLPEIW